MRSEQDKTSGDEIRNLLREIRDGQRELIEMAKQDRAEWAKQRDAWEKWQSERDEPDWQTLNQANRYYVKETDLRRQICTVLFWVIGILLVCMLIAGVFGWLELLA